MQPLAERLRPKTFEDIAGQEHLVGPGTIFRKMVESGNIGSMIFWGPPGVGKTTLAQMISGLSGRQFYMLSAVSSGVKDVREVIERAKRESMSGIKSPILFIDEIHRFSKSQQDSLLAAVEQGIVTLIGATTENPSFEVISPLLSRCHVNILKSLEAGHLTSLLNSAIKRDEFLSAVKWKITETDALFRFSGGDARKLLNIIEMLYHSQPAGNIQIDNKTVTELLQQNMAMYDKGGEMHYDVISAFIKSVRGSDPNAAVYYMARMLDGGEDPLFIARRLIILAAEDIGLANPNGLLLAQSCFQAVHSIGMPEARIILSEATIYLATSPKSNSAYQAVDAALEFVRKTGNLPVPLHLRNAPTKLMKNIGYGKDYKYAHSYEGNFVDQEFLPDKASGTIFYNPQENLREKEIKLYLSVRWKGKYGYK
ncbi:MAG: AAA family ATPase [Bacteroidetes bacterium HGW-Bacteroidetes-21]|nr:MAG: AAA family ATPase [Bacteroidetes bacterium HGW-Bacteroidetes-21]